MSSSERAWDLIVVGAGSAGAALAARSAQRGQRVLLIEAGPDYRSRELHEVWRSPNGIRPTLHPEASGELVWGELTASRTDAQEARFFWRGRGLGGSSAINGQIAIRPPREDFDAWAEAGCEGWSWDEVLPYFCRLESDHDFGDAPYHGSSGPIPVVRMPREDWGSVDGALAQAGLASGFAWSEDVNAPAASGVSPYPINSLASRRVSTNDGYLEPVRELENLTILGDALADRVIVRGGRATGIETVEGGARRAHHGDEIVLCAGVVHSPAILMRSGIGPAPLLEELGIEVVVDLPVGEGLQDHPALLVGLPLRPETAIPDPDARHTNCCIRFASGHADGSSGDLMVVSLNQIAMPTDQPGASGGTAALSAGVRLSRRAAETKADVGALDLWLNGCHSRGEVVLRSTDPREQPAISERMLSDERDLARMRQGARLLADLATSDAVADICTVPAHEANPALWAALEDDGELDDFLLAAVTDAMHATSTCRMGPADSPSSVVDPQCRVLGVPGLRVADASVFPSCPRANTNLASIAVGELVADRLA